MNDLELKHTWGTDTLKTHTPLLFDEQDDFPGNSLNLFFSSSTKC